MTPCTDTSRVITVVNVRSSAYDPTALHARLDAAPPLPGCRDPFARDLDDRGDQASWSPGRDARSTRSSRRRSVLPCAGRHRSSSARPARRRPRTGCRSSNRWWASSPLPSEWARSITAAHFGWFDTMISPVDLSTQRNAGMSTVEPCRIPHWLTPVCDDHPVSHSTRWWLPSRSQRCRLGTSPDRMRPPQDGVGDAVELDEHDAGHVGHVGAVRSACGPGATPVGRTRRRRRAPAAPRSPWSRRPGRRRSRATSRSRRSRHPAAVPAPMRRTAR